MQPASHYTVPMAMTTADAGQGRAPDAGGDDLAASQRADEAEQADRHLVGEHQREPEAAEQASQTCKLTMVKRLATHTSMTCFRTSSEHDQSFAIAEASRCSESKFGRCMCAHSANSGLSADTCYPRIVMRTSCCVCTQEDCPLLS